MHKLQIGIIAGVAVAVMAIYAGASEPPAVRYDAAYCAGRLSDLRSFNAGAAPRGAPLTKASTRAYVESCAAHDTQFAALAKSALAAN